jgi:hypothetical protein
MSYLEELKEHYKAVRQRMRKNAIKEPKALPPPTPESTEVLGEGLVTVEAQNKIVTEAITITGTLSSYDHMQTVRLAEELMGSPRLPPLPGLVLHEAGAVRWMRILHAVALQHKTDAEEILGRSRRRSVVMARFEVFYRLRVELAYSYPKIGKLMKKDHSTIVHGVNKVRQKLLDDKRKMADDGDAFLVTHPYQSAIHTDLSAA